MTLYVDPLMDRGWNIHRQRVRSCHLFTDQVDLAELHTMAARIGCRREWFHNKPGAPHYDLTAMRRQSAIGAGAVAVDNRTASGIFKSRRHEVRRAGRLPHSWDDDAICTFCGFDGAEDHWLNNNLRLEIGNDEYTYRKEQGEFDAGRWCEVRTNQAQHG